MKGVRSSGRLSLACVGALLEFAACDEEKPDVKGTGLGLAIVKNIVESNDGSVSAGEREGGGFLIKIKLKIHRAQKKKLLPPKRKKRGRGGKSKRKTRGRGKKPLPRGARARKTGKRREKHEKAVVETYLTHARHDFVPACLCRGLRGGKIRFLYRGGERAARAI